MRCTPLALIAALLLAACATPEPKTPGTEQPNLLRFVDPRIGVLGEGSTVIGPALPFGSFTPAPTHPMAATTATTRTARSAASAKPMSAAPAGASTATS